jgi:hypothetical protein
MKDTSSQWFIPILLAAGAGLALWYYWIRVSEPDVTPPPAPPVAEAPPTPPGLPPGGRGAAAAEPRTVAAA